MVLTLKTVFTTWVWESCKHTLQPPVQLIRIHLTAVIVSKVKSQGNVICGVRFKYKNEASASQQLLTQKISVDPFSVVKDHPQEEMWQSFGKNVSKLYFLW